MLNPITVSDYAAEWAIKDYHIEPRAKPGYLSREEVIAFYGTLGIQGIEVNHGYWEDYDTRRLKRLAKDAGVPIVTYVGLADLAVPPAELHRSLDEVYALLDRTAGLGASKLFLLPAIYKPEFPLEQLQGWLVEGLRQAAERAMSMDLSIISENIDYPPIRPLMGRGSQCRDICARVDSPAFRLIYDVAAPLFVGQDSLHTLKDMSMHFVHVHLKNFRPLAPGEEAERFLAADDGKRYTGTTLDRGALPIEAVLAELRRLGYSGFIQIEYQGEDDPRIAVRHNVEYLRGLLG